MALDEYGKQGTLPVMLPVPVHVTLHDKSPLQGSQQAVAEVSLGSI